MSRKWDYTVRCYSSENELIMETVHQGEHSRDLEIHCRLQLKVQNRDVARIEISNHIDPAKSGVLYVTKALAVRLVREAGNGLANWESHVKRSS
jgi:hypothetical protein